MNTYTSTPRPAPQRVAPRRPPLRFADEHGHPRASWRWVTALLVGILCGLGLSVAAQAEGITYAPPSTRHHCVDIGQPPGVIDLSVLPSGPRDRDWIELRYLTHDGRRNPGSWRGTEGMHTSDYHTDLEELGYNADPVAVRDAYCARDTELQQRARAVRLAGEMVTPFEPGFSQRGARSWSSSQWQTFLDYNRRAQQLAYGADYELWRAIVVRQLALTLEACDQGTGVAATSAAGAWQRNKAGACRPTSWRWGRPDPAWARPVRIELPPRELDLPRGYDPGRLSTGLLSTDMVRR